MPIAKLIAKLIFAVYSEFEILRNRKNQSNNELIELVRNVLVGERATN